MDMTARNQYRAWAAECKERAQQSQGFRSTYEWLKLAQAWEHLADGGAAQAVQGEMDKQRTYSR